MSGMCAICKNDAALPSSPLELCGDCQKIAERAALEADIAQRTAENEARIIESEEAA